MEVAICRVWCWGVLRSGVRTPNKNYQHGKALKIKKDCRRDYSIRRLFLTQTRIIVVLDTLKYRLRNKPKDVKQMAKCLLIGLTPSSPKSDSQSKLLISLQQVRN